MMILNEDELQNLRIELGFDPKLRRVLNAIPTEHDLGYSEIGRRANVSGIYLDRALGKLSELGAVAKRHINNVPQGDNDYYLRLVEL